MESSDTDRSIEMTRHRRIKSEGSSRDLERTAKALLDCVQIEIAVPPIREILRSSFARLLKLTFIFVDGREGRRSKINRVAFHLASKNFCSTFSRLLLRLVVNFEKLQSLFVVSSVFLRGCNSFSFFLFIYIYTFALLVFLDRPSSARQIVSSLSVALLNLLPPAFYLSRKLFSVSKLIRGDIPRFNR